MKFVCFSLLFHFLLARSAFTPVPSVDCQSQPQASYPFCNPQLDAATRAMDLVSRLNVYELINQTSSIAPGIPRLGINAYNWRSNCLHGWDKGGGPNWLGYTWTVFPAPIGLGASFDSQLVQRVGEVTSTEGRALHNLIMTHYNGSSQEASGVNCFSPNVNLLRDPRWGRALETYGEDPYLISIMGLAYTRGLQEGPDSRYVKIAACAKHFAVHSGPDQLRKVFIADATMHDLFDTFLPMFKTQVMAGKVMQIMPAYSSLKCYYAPNGAPDAANQYLLKTVLRGQFGAENISVCSDNGAVEEVYTTHHYVDSLYYACAVCMNATTDLDLGTDEVYPHYLYKTYSNNIVTLDTIKKAVERSFYLRIRVGDFDPVSMVPYQLINASQLNTPESQALNLKAALESIVLLKNSGDLPLRVGSLKLAIVGPNANSSLVLLSSYMGIPPYNVTVLEGLQDALKDTATVVQYAPGCADVKCSNKTEFNAALSIVSDADYVIAVMGLDSTVEREGEDRANTTCESEPVDNLALPGCQTALIEAIVSSNPRVILVLINGGPLSIPTLYENKGVLAVVEAFYPGPLGGYAVVDVLFGKYNPGGKMPCTVFNSTKDIAVATNYDMSAPPGRTYRYYTGKPLFSFGYGLSYTDFKYSQLDLSTSSVEVCSSLIVKVTVQNVGQVAGDEVIQIYAEPPRISGKPFIPNIELVGFERVSLTPSANYTGEFELNAYLLSLVDHDGKHYVFPGQYTVVATGGVDDRLTASFMVNGVVTPVEKCDGAPKCFGC